jgi:hypothetical protein
MEREVFEYRQTHPKCRYCKYLEHVVKLTLPVDYYNCKAKDVVINCISIPRVFCSCYRVKE